MAENQIYVIMLHYYICIFQWQPGYMLTAVMFATLITVMGQ